MKAELTRRRLLEADTQELNLKDQVVSINRVTKVVKGGKMSFVGLKKPKDRANVIAFMRMMADEPLPLP